MTKKKIMLIAIALVMVLNLFLPAAAENTTDDDLVAYSALILGYPERDVQELYAEYDGDQSAFLDEVDTMLADIVYFEQWNTAVTANVNLDQLSRQYNVSRDLLERHLNIVGSEYFLRNLSSQQQISPLSSGSGSTSMSTEFFRAMCSVAHEGNLFVTKDSKNLGYRHGHVGIISSHDTSANDPTTKMIAEAEGFRDNEEDEVVNQPLSEWSGRTTLAIYYPHNTTTAQREYAGYMGSQFDYCGYKLTIKKGEAVEELPYVNCISLVYLAYKSIDGNYDLLPQVSNDQILYPSQAAFSTVVTLKTLADGSMARTTNWNNYNWGFNFNG